MVGMLVFEILACWDVNVFAVCVVCAVVLVEFVIQTFIKGDWLDFRFEDIRGADLELEFDMAFRGISVDVCVGYFCKINSVVESDVVDNETDGCSQYPKNVKTNDDSSNKPLCISSCDGSHIQLSKYKQTLLPTWIMKDSNSSRK